MGIARSFEFWVLSLWDQDMCLSVFRIVLAFMLQ